jgi:hypothetical protein
MKSLPCSFNLIAPVNVGALLGIEIRCTSDGYLEVVQPGLIQKIVTLYGIENESNAQQTSGPDREHAWICIGMLTYLGTSTQPDITFAMHQDACFSVFPKQIHELAIHCVV